MLTVLDLRAADGGGLDHDGTGAARTEPEPLADDGSRPLIDVLMPAYNAGRTIRQTLQSVFDQTLSRFRLIVVDDGCTDDTVEIVSEFGGLPQPILLIRQPNKGIVDALNEGLRRVTAPFVARIDADDISFSNRFAEQIEFLERNPSFVGVSSSFYEIDGSGHLNGKKYNSDGRSLEGDLFMVPAWEPYLPHTLLTMRSKVFKELKYRYVHHAEDADLFWRALRHGKLTVLPQVHGCYRIHTDSISGSSVLEGRIQAMFAQLAALSARRAIVGLPDIEFDRSMLERARAAGRLTVMAQPFETRLTAAEYRYLNVASIAKLVEFIDFRPYKLEAADIRQLLTSMNSPEVSTIHMRRYMRSLVRRALKDYFRRAPFSATLPLLLEFPSQIAQAFLTPGRRPKQRWG